jgi:hypothetical protein
VLTNILRLYQTIEASAIHSKWLSSFKISYLNFHLIILRRIVDLCNTTSTVLNIVTKISVYTTAVNLVWISDLVLWLELRIWINQKCFSDFTVSVEGNKAESNISPVCSTKPKISYTWPNDEFPLLLLPWGIGSFASSHSELIKSEIMNLIDSWVIDPSAGRYLQWTILTQKWRMHPWVEKD